MVKRKLLWIVAVASIAVLGALAGTLTWGYSLFQRSTDPPDPAPGPERLIELYEEYEQSHDPRLLGLYRRDAVISMTRLYPGGQVRELEMTWEKYRVVFLLALPLAILRGDTSEYSDFSFQEEAEGRVRVRAARRPRLKNYESPIEWVLQPQSDGEWRIAEESVVSRPF